jgi:hypothetical protein
METILFYTGWFIVTTVWSSFRDKTKKDVIGRYCFTFLATIIIYSIKFM